MINNGNTVIIYWYLLHITEQSHPCHHHTTFTLYYCLDLKAQLIPTSLYIFPLTIFISFFFKCFFPPCLSHFPFFTRNLPSFHPLSPYHPFSTLSFLSHYHINYPLHHFICHFPLFFLYYLSWSKLITMAISTSSPTIQFPQRLSFLPYPFYHHSIQHKYCWFFSTSFQCRNQCHVFSVEPFKLIEW